MKTLITPEQVIAIAFSESEHILTSTISPADIAAATDRYILPIMGQSFINSMLAGRYAEVLSDYVAPALAFGVRVIVQPTINVRTADVGLVAPTGEVIRAASQSAAEALQHSLKIRMRQLLRRLSRHLSSVGYAEYDKTKDVLNRCSIDGGFVQTI